MKTRLIGVVGCGARKREVPAPAKDLYTSRNFKLHREFVEAFTDDWFILSAKHGVLSPNAVTAPYDTSLYDLSPEKWKKWESQVRADLRTLYSGQLVIFLSVAPAAYSAVLSEFPTVRLTRGLGIIRQGIVLRKLLLARQPQTRKRTSLL